MSQDIVKAMTDLYSNVSFGGKGSGGGGGGGGGGGKKNKPQKPSPATTNKWGNLGETACVAASGASYTAIGAAAGSIFPGPGTAIGAVLGGVVGTIVGAVSCDRINGVDEYPG